MERWKNIPGFSGRYQASNVGNIAEIINGERHILRQYNSDGYLNIPLRIGEGGRKKLFRAHRLVALAWIENPTNRPHIDHINGVRSDNRIENLRWCTPYENMNNPITKPHTGRKRIEVLQFAPCDRYAIKPIRKFSGLKEAANSVGTIESTIYHAILSGSLTYGYRWRFGNTKIPKV